MQVSNLSPQQLRKAADLKERIDALQDQLSELLGAAAETVVTETPEKSKAARRRKRRLSAQGRANIRAGVAKRMARRAGKAPASSQGSGTPPDGELTVKAAVLKALESGEAMGKTEIAQRVSDLRGKKTKASTLNPTLHEMKVKDKTIVNPERGMYRLR